MNSCNQPSCVTAFSVCTQAVRCKVDQELKKEYFSLLSPTCSLRTLLFLVQFPFSISPLQQCFHGGVQAYNIPSQAMVTQPRSMSVCRGFFWIFVWTLSTGTHLPRTEVYFCIKLHSQWLTQEEWWLKNKQAKNHLSRRYGNAQEMAFCPTKLWDSSSTLFCTGTVFENLTLQSCFKDRKKDTLTPK